MTSVLTVALLATPATLTISANAERRGQMTYKSDFPHSIVTFSFINCFGFVPVDNSDVTVTVCVLPLAVTEETDTYPIPEYQLTRSVETCGI